MTDQTENNKLSDKVSVWKILVYCILILIFVFVSNNLIIDLGFAVPEGRYYFHQLFIGRRFLFSSVILANLLNFLFAWYSLKHFNFDLKMIGWIKSRPKKDTKCYFILFMLAILILVSLTIAKVSLRIQGVELYQLVYGFILSTFPAAVFEEIIFRGILLDLLLGRTNFITANILQALIFGLAHFFTHSFKNIIIFVIPVGLFLGWAKHRTSSIKTSSTLHAMINGFADYVSFLKF